MIGSALCIGGPRHGVVLPYSADRVLVPLAFVAHRGLQPSGEYVWDSYKVGIYNVRKFGVGRGLEHGEQHAPVTGFFLLWQGGWYQDRRVEDWATDAVMLCGYLSLLFTLLSAPVVHDVETCGPESIDFNNYCIDGTFYGYCTSPMCRGCCEPQGRCRCRCHIASTGADETGRQT